MKILTIETFLPHVKDFPQVELLSPAEASKLQLRVAVLVLDYCVDMPLLKFLSRFFTPQSYDDVIEERNIEHQCGYLLCNMSPEVAVRRSSSLNGSTAVSTKFQIYNRKPSMILPNTYSSQYCCKYHYQASMFYRNQLSLEALFARKNILLVPPFAQIPGTWYENNLTCLEEVLAKHKELKQEGVSLSDVIAMMNGLSVAEAEKDTSGLVKLLDDFEIVEKVGGVDGDSNSDMEYDRVTSSRVVEGYPVNAFSSLDT